MATTGCAVAGSSTTLSPMKQLQALHPLACRSPPCMPLTHASKLGSLLFFFYLPTRLSPILSTSHRLPLPPSLCGHGELEIVSVKELADGFLHFSFGTPQNSHKMNELSSSSGEHIAGKLSVPCRLPSKFMKKSPIPVAGARQRRRQGESSSKEEPTETIPLSVKEAVKSLSRPKSSFVKRSPIPKRNEPSLGAGRVLNAATVHDKSMSKPQGTKVGSKTVGTSMRPRSSVFVRKSPIPSSVAKHNGRPPWLSTNSDALPSQTADNAPVAQGTLNVSKASRPKSAFSRRSPIVKVQHLSSKVSGTRGRASPTPMSGRDSSKADEDSTFKASAESLKTSEESPDLTVDLDKCKLPELRNLAKIRGIKGYSKLKKGELLDLLKNLDN